MVGRGTYAKGDAKRQEILDTALRLVEEKGYAAVTLREIAAETNLTKNGLLHHFTSRDEIFVGVLRRRDDLARTRYAGLSHAPVGVVDHLGELSGMPGLAEIYARLSVEAARSEHPAHAYFAERYDAVRGAFREMFERFEASGDLLPDLDPETCATLLMASTEGLQIQWLYDSSIDLEGHITSFFALCGVSLAPSELPAAIRP
ncbi:TetR/AcrR family transcriptional regulator [Frigoribacterium salinisoli]